MHFSPHTVSVLNSPLGTTLLQYYKSGMNLVYRIEVFAEIMVCRVFNPMFKMVLNLNFPQLKKF